MPFSLYIHLPYCLVKCPYCDFNAYAAKSWPEEQYMEALAAELRHYASQPPWAGQPIATIYFGGGTPSLFAPQSFARFLARVGELAPIAEDAEITLEADPATVTREKLSGYRALGINRLSVGVQSFHPQLLKTLGRIHTPEDAHDTLTWARAAGFTNLSMDVIFAVPGQTMTMLTDDLTLAHDHALEHLSTYSLTYEEHTPFFAMRKKGTLRPVEEDEEVAMYSLIQERCVAAGYRHYEISSFARPGFSARHNANYWNGTSYLSLGAGAHSFSAASEWGTRWSNERLPRRYMEKALAHGNATTTSETLTQAQAMGEFVFLNLRQLHGLAPAAFVERFQVDFAEQFPHVTDLLAEGLLIADSGRITLSPQGLLLADTLFASFV
ncbi:MAG: radical SAM family heme chaperone HemW [Deltaproteobacteria bacterium]|nr:radical SAM family heme chaperone HemW [Deltaproteobacteria bacterium]